MPSSAILPCMPTEFIQKHNARNAGFAGRPSNKAPRAAMECYGCGLSDSNFSTVLFEYTPRGPSFLNNYGLSGYPLQINVAGKTDIGCSEKTDADTVPCVKRVTCLKIPAGFPDSSASSSSIKALEPWFLPTKMMVFVQIKCTLW